MHAFAVEPFKIQNQVWWQVEGSGSECHILKGCKPHDMVGGYSVTFHLTFITSLFSKERIIHNGPDSVQ